MKASYEAKTVLQKFCEIVHLYKKKKFFNFEVIKVMKWSVRQKVFRNYEIAVCNVSNLR